LQTLRWREPDSNHRSRGGVRCRAVGPRSRRLFRERAIWAAALETSVVSRGTDGSNPVPSSSELQTLGPSRRGVGQPGGKNLSPEDRAERSGQGSTRAQAPAGALAAALQT
jgi:hypothetical protein